MGKQDDRENFWLMVALIIIFIITMLVSRVSQSDIDACVNQTGWSEARCAMELSR